MIKTAEKRNKRPEKEQILYTMTLFTDKLKYTVISTKPFQGQFFFLV